MSDTAFVLNPKFAVLFQPKRIKAFYGGRGGGKSWALARAILRIGISRQIRVLCCREQQKSIAESVHKLLADQIVTLGWESFYEIQRDKIYGKNGTEISFEGIRHNTSKIKSYEGIDICWIEEADALSQESWLIIEPTIRKAGSEIWVSFNPLNRDDFSYQHFVLNPPEDCVSVFISWRDNPWFSEEMAKAMEALKKTDFDLYQHVWEGMPRVLLAGSVYMEELRKVRGDGRITTVPHLRGIPVWTFWDIGISDSTTIWFRQRIGFEWHYIDYFEAKQKPLDFYLDVIQKKSYLYGKHCLPHDAKAREKGSGMSIEERFRKVWPGQVKVLKKLSVEDGIDAARTILGNSWFDEKACARGLECLFNYKYEIVDQKTGQLSRKPVHDWASDGADAFRYSALETRQNRDEDGEEKAARAHPSGIAKIRQVLAANKQSPFGWMR